MKIEFLYFENCPGSKPALSPLEQILLENDIEASINKIEVTSPELAVQHHFLGSSSIRIIGMKKRRPKGAPFPFSIDAET
jgi:hypothetical protein